MKELKEFTKEEFITERTRIISEMLDNPDEYEIYPTTKCFYELDKLYDRITALINDNYVPKEFLNWVAFMAPQIYYREVDDKWIWITEDLSDYQVGHMNHSEFSFDGLIQYWKEQIRDK